MIRIMRLDLLKAPLSKCKYKLPATDECIPESSFVICLELGTAVSLRSKIVNGLLSQARHRKSIYLIMHSWIGLQLDLVTIYTLFLWENVL